MALGDVIVEGELSDEEARHALCGLFGIHDREVMIVESRDALPSCRRVCRVLCVKWTIERGHFRTVLSIDEGEFTGWSPENTCQRLSTLLGRACLMSDQAVNPYTMLLVQGCETVRQVSLNAEAWEHGEYSIENSPGG